MSTSKKVLVILSILTLLIGIAGCGSNSGQVAKGSAVKIAIAQVAEHPSLDAARQGFLDVLEENGYIEGENLTVDYKNAQGDMPTLNTIASNFAADKNDLILAIATPTAQAIAKATQGSEIPVLFTAVTDPVSAELVKSMDKPETNLTGTTDMAPLEQQVELIKEIDPEVKAIGVLYNTSEVNSVVQVEMIKEAASKLGMEVVEAAATNSSEVDLAAKSLVGKVDAIFVPTDNTVVSAVETVVKVAKENGLLLVSAEGDSVKRGCIATIGIDYYELGRQTGEMALRILSGEAKPAEMAVERQDAQDIVVNLKGAKEFGISIPQSVLDRAKEIIE